MKVSIVLPVHNPHPGWCDELIRNIKAVEAATGRYAATDYILVNDGSQDGFILPDEIHKLTAALPSLRCLSRKHNKGKGFSLREGMNAAEPSTYYIYTDFDFPFGTQSIVDTLKALEAGADVIAARRNDSYLEALQCCKRYFLTHLVRQLNRSLLGLNGHDAQAGLKGFNQRGLAVFLRTRINSFLFDTEFLSMVNLCGLTLSDVEVTIADGITMSKKRLSVLVREGAHLTLLLIRSLLKFRYALEGIYEDINEPHNPAHIRYRRIRRAA